MLIIFLVQHVRIFRYVINSVTELPTDAAQFAALMSMIKVADMTKSMRQTTGLNRPKPFHIIYVTADRKRNKGGEIRELHKAILLTKKRVADRTVNLQALGSKTVVKVHLDLILYFNSQPVA